MQKVGYATTQKRYGIGSSTVTLIMKRFKELGIPLEELKTMPPKELEDDQGTVVSDLILPARTGLFPKPQIYAA